VRLVFFGDSICVGQYVPTPHTWVSRLSGKLHRVAEAHGVELSVVNASVNGSTTRAALERMPQDVQKDGADVLLVQFGLNDCNYWQTDAGVPRVSPQAFAANLEEIVERGRRSGASRVLLNNNHSSGRDQDPLPGLGEPYERSNERYNEIVRSVAQRLGDRVVFTDVEAAFKRHTGGCRERLLALLLAAPDLIHLSEAGHAVYAEILGPVVERALLDVIGERLA